MARGFRKRMKWKKWGQGILAAGVSAGLVFAMASCAASNTVDYLYLASSKNNPGQINVYRVDSQTGGLQQIPNSPYPAGRNPVGLVILPNGKNLYVINHDDNTIIDYGIGTDAKLYPQHTCTTPGTEPVAVAMNPAGTLLFVVDTYAPPFTDLNPGYGAMVVYPIQPDGSLGTGNNNCQSVTQTLSNGQGAGYFPLQTAPTAVNVLASGSTVYVTDRLLANASGCSTGAGALEALTIHSDGTLATTTGSPFCAGTSPSAVTSSPSGSYLYVTDSTLNGVLGYSVGSFGALTAFPGGLIAAGQAPSSLTIDPRGLFMYVTNRTSGNVQSYSLAADTGIPTSTGSAATGPQPQCVIIEPHLQTFLYTADFNGAGATGYKIDPTTGLLSGTENSPYSGTGLSTCLAATPHNGAS